MQIAGGACRCYFFDGSGMELVLFSDGPLCLKHMVNIAVCVIFGALLFLKEIAGLGS